MKDRTKERTAEKQELLILAMLEYLIEHGDYHDIEAVKVDIENRMKGINLFDKWAHEMLGQTLEDRNAEFRKASFWRGE